MKCPNCDTLVPLEQEQGNPNRFFCNSCGRITDVGRGGQEVPAGTTSSSEVVGVVQAPRPALGVPTMRKLSVLVVLLLASITISAQQTVVTCLTGQTPTSVINGLVVTVTCTTPTTPPPPPPTNNAVITNATANPSNITSTATTTVTLNWTQTGSNNPLSIVITPGNHKPAVTARSFVVPAPTTTTMYTVTYNSGTAQQTQRSVTVTVSLPPPPPPLQAPVVATFTATPATINLGEASVLTGSLSGGAPTTLTITPNIGSVLGQSSVTVKPTVTTTYTLTATNSAGTSSLNATVTVNQPPPSNNQIWGPVDPTILGDFTAAEHDVFVINGNDGFFYRKWHPQCLNIPNGLAGSGFIRKCFAHDHGDNPDSMRDPWVYQNWDGRFGYMARRYKDHPGEPNGHVEAHEGYKVFVANKGDTNDEGRVNRTWTLAYFHMGTGGPARFQVPHHSGSVASRHDWPGESQMRQAFHILQNTGGVATVCDPRVAAPSKDVMQLNSPCKLNSQYEIWRAETAIRVNGQEIARVFQTPASFDPITVRNPANPTEVVYADDARMAGSKAFPGDNWSGNKDLARETYAQNPYLYTDGPTATDSGEYCIGPLGVGVGNESGAACTGDTSRAFFEPNLNIVGLKSTQDNLQFKMRVDYGRACEPNRDGQCVRPRAGLEGSTDPSKIGLKN